MNPTQGIAILMAIQIIVISISFGMLYAIDIQENNAVDYVNISGKNRMFTALALHEMNEYSSGISSKAEIGKIFDEYYDNILLLKNGGDFS